MSRGWTLGETILVAGTISVVVPYAVLFAVVMWKRLRSPLARTASNAASSHLDATRSNGHLRDDVAPGTASAARSGRHTRVTEHAMDEELVVV